MNKILKLTLIGLLPIILSCSSLTTAESHNKTDCNENLAFKKLFFEHVENIENNIYEQQGESFRNSLTFIGKYTHVSFEAMSNYARTYPSGVFEKDKVIWLDWYENNKCNNIQLLE